MFPIDPNGNLTAKTEGADNWVYTWNAENQLIQVQNNSSTVATFAYDPIGRRVEKVAGGVTTAWAYEGASILRQVVGASTLKYVHGLDVDEPLASDDGTALSFFHADGLGSITKTSNSAGGVTLTREYDAWGNLQAGNTTPAYAFTGREWDPETELYYYRARYYDPAIGRFLREDPLHLDAGHVNFYVYVSNNPVRLTDPTGMVIWVCNRPAQGMPGNHTYLYDPKTGKNCGRGSNSGKEDPTKDPNTACVPVPNSEGKEAAILSCCGRERKNAGVFMPPINDCHTLKENTLKCAGLPDTPAPGGRLGCPTGRCPNPEPKTTCGSCTIQ